MIPYQRLIAIDPSLTCSGWALLSISTEELLGVGKLRSLPPKISLSERLQKLQQRIEDTLGGLNLGPNDVLVCEAPTSMLDPRGAFKVEQVRGIFEAVARTKNITVPGRINPRTVQRDLMGLRGAQQRRDAVKDTACQVVKTLFGDQLRRLGFDVSDRNLAKHQDIVDAILIGAIGVTKVKQGSVGDIAITEVFREQKSRRKSSRNSWGSGEENSFGWTEAEISKMASGSK